LLTAHPARARLHRCVIRHESELPSTISTYHIPSIAFLREVESKPKGHPPQPPFAGEGGSASRPFTPSRQRAERSARKARMRSSG
jgi:hypothetical protein